MNNKGALSSIDLTEIKVLSKRQVSIPQLVSGKAVLSIGCVDMLNVYDYDELSELGMHQLCNLKSKAKSVVGIDINKEGIDFLNSKGFNVHYLDVFNINLNSEVVKEHYDVIVISHVIEHIPNMYEFLLSVVENFTFNELVIAVPNAYNYSSIINVVFNKREALSNDHYYTFTPLVLKKLIESLDLKVESMWFDRHEVPITIEKKSKMLAKVVSLMRNLIFGNNGDLIIRAVRNINN